MSEEVDYLNFLKTFYHEEIFLVDDVTAKTDNLKPAEKQTTHSPDEEAMSKVEEPIPEISFQWNFLGDENADIAFIINEKSAEVLPADTRDRFITMLNNLKLEVEKILIANVAGKLGRVVENKVLSTKASRIILMGTKDVFPALAVNHYQAESHEGKQILFSPSFSEITKDKKQVLAFWDAMKKFI